MPDDAPRTMAAQQPGLAFASGSNDDVDLVRPLTTFEKTRAPLPVRLLNVAGRPFVRRKYSANELIDLAKARTGLSDFGGGDFFEPLSRLLESCYREGRLNVVGRLALPADVIRTLSNRLKLWQDRQSHPQIAQEEIRAPVFIVGLPRSGTTLLHILLGSDPANRVPLTWEVMSPSPPNDEDRQRRIAQAEKNLSKLHWLAPTFRHVHTMGAELPQECVSLMSPTFLSDQFDVMFDVPAYRAWYLQQDLRPAYEYHRHFLQHLQYRQRATRWILKAPAHMFAAPALLSIYPDARFIQTHRDPLDAIASVSSLVAILRKIFSEHVDLGQIGRDAVDYWAQALHHFLRERERLPNERVFDLTYAEIRRDAVGAVRRVYEHFNWEFTPAIEQRMRATLAAQTHTENGKHRYDAAQFGLTSRDRFEAYCERFGLTNAKPNDAQPSPAETRSTIA